MFKSPSVKSTASQAIQQITTFGRTSFFRKPCFGQILIFSAGLRVEFWTRASWLTFAGREVSEISGSGPRGMAPNALFFGKKIQCQWRFCSGALTFWCGCYCCSCSVVVQCILFEPWCCCFELPPLFALVSSLSCTCRLKCDGHRHAACARRTMKASLYSNQRIWLWVKNRYPKRNPGKWKHGPKSAVPW